MSETENKPAHNASHSETGGKEYEMSYFLSTDIPESNVDDAASELNLLITESGGSGVALEIPKRRWLSYKIKKQNEAYFGTAYFNISAEGLLKIKKSLALNKKVLRYIILNKPLKPKPMAIPKLQIETSTPAQSFDKKLESILNG